MNATFSILQRKLKPIGWSGLTGAVLLAGSVLLSALATVPLTTEIGSLHLELETLQLRRASGEFELVQRSQTRAERVAEFYDSFPPRSTFSRWMGEVNAAAVRQGVRLSAGEYQVQQRRDQRLIAHQITLPIRASYLDTRRFLADLLENVPPVAVDEVRFGREGIDERELDVRVRLTLYVSGD